MDFEVLEDARVMVFGGEPIGHRHIFGTPSPVPGTGSSRRKTTGDTSGSAGCRGTTSSFRSRSEGARGRCSETRPRRGASDTRRVVMDRAFEGLRVVDFTRLLPGPLASRWLVEHGALVIKVEAPPGGDMTRWVPPLVGDPPRASLFEVLNAGKESVALDLASEEGRVAAAALVATADVVFESFRPGVMARFGLGADELTRRHPRLVYASLSGWGQTGPDRGRPGHDLGYLARSGALGLAPVVPGVQVADVGGSLVAMAGIAMALYRRERMGQGAVLDLSLSDAAVPFGATHWGKIRGGEHPRLGDELLDGSRPAYTIYEVADGHLAVSALEPKFWTAFCGAVDRPDLVTSGLDGGERGAAVRAEVQAILRSKTRREWVEHFAGVEACVEPVLLPDEVPADPQHAARAMVGPDGDPKSPWRSAPAPRRGAPSLGADSETRLREAGVDDATIAKVLARLSPVSSQ